MDVKISGWTLLGNMIWIQTQNLAAHEDYRLLVNYKSFPSGSDGKESTWSIRKRDFLIIKKKKIWDTTSVSDCSYPTWDRTDWSYRPCHEIQWEGPNIVHAAYLQNIFNLNVIMRTTFRQIYMVEYTIQQFLCDLKKCYYRERWGWAKELLQIRGDSGHMTTECSMKS